MKLVTFKPSGQPAQAGWLEENTIYPIILSSDGKIMTTMLELIQQSSNTLNELLNLPNQKNDTSFKLEDVELLAPLPNPSSVRDFMAFEKHLLNASKRSGLQIHPQWYEIPVFYFSNHQSIHGPGQDVEIPSTSKMFDYELEIAAVIGKQGKNISASEVDEYIFGYTILNEWLARDLQMQEMQVGLGPA